jgi:hypothetical protein
MPIFPAIGTAILGSAGAAAAGATVTAVVGGVATAAAVGGAAYAGVSSSQNARNEKSEKRSAAQRLAEQDAFMRSAMGAPVNALEAARTDLQRRRKISLLTGGDTTYAGGASPILSSTGGKTLLGA